MLICCMCVCHMFIKILTYLSTFKFTVLVNNRVEIRLPLIVSFRLWIFFVSWCCVVVWTEAVFNRDNWQILFVITFSSTGLVSICAHWVLVIMYYITGRDVVRSIRVRSDINANIVSRSWSLAACRKWWWAWSIAHFQWCCSFRLTPFHPWLSAATKYLLQNAAILDKKWWVCWL